MNSLSVFGFVLCLAIYTSAAPQISKESGSGRVLTYLGAFEGRLFYQAETGTANYDTSVTRCATQGMTIAQIHSPEELAYLQTVLLSSRSYWVAGKSIQVIFGWADGSDVVEVPVVADSPVCLYIPLSSSSTTELHDGICSEMLYTLCHSA